MDLDVRNYTPAELRTFFSIKPSQTYSAAEIELRAYEIRERLVSGNYIKKGQMRQFVTFMAAAAAALVADNISSIQTNTTQPSQKNQVHTIIPATPYIAPNELYVKTQSQLVSIDTRFRENAYSTSASNFTISLPVKLSKVITVEVVSFDMAFDTISTVYQAIRNNFFVLRMLLHNNDCVYKSDTPLRTLEYTVTVPDGHYATTTQLVDAVQASIYAAFDDCTMPDAELFKTIEITVDERTGCVNLYTNHPDVQSLELDFSKNEEGESDRHQIEYYTKLGRVLGFTRRMYRGQTEYLGETRADPFLCMRYLYLDIADFQNQYAPTFVPAFSNINLSSSVIAKMVRSSEPCDSAATLKLITEPRIYFGPTDVSRMHVRILDAYGNILDVANADYSFTLRVRYMYDSALVKN